MSQRWRSLCSISSDEISVFVQIIVMSGSSLAVDFVDFLWGLVERVVSDGSAVTVSVIGWPAMIASCPSVSTICAANAASAKSCASVDE